MNTEIDQRRRNVRVLELLERSHAAHERGDDEQATALLTEASEVDATVMTAIRGGMLIGEIPTPDQPAWHDYLDGQRDHLAALEDAAT